MKLDINIGRNYARINVDRAVVVCHGLPYEPGSAIDKSYDSIAEFFSKRGLPAVVFDFSGTGKSQGSFSLISWLEDLERIAESFDEIHVVGFSMGGAVAYALDGAESYSIISAPFSPDMFSESMLKEIYSNALLKGTLKGIKDYETFSRRFVEEFQSISPSSVKPKKNVIVVHAVDDEVVPFEEGERIFRHSKKPKKLVKVENGGHFLRRSEEVMSIVYGWIAEKREGEKTETLRL